MILAMGEPRLPHDLRIGRFLLDDILHAFGFGQWILTNLTHRSQLSAPLLAEIMAGLHAAGLAAPRDLGDGDIFYDDPFSLMRENLRAPLDRDEVETLLARVFARAGELNRERASVYSFRNIWLFGSCLRGAAHPHDIDLGVEIHRDGSPLPYTPAHVLGPPTEFDGAARPLALRKPAILTLHHIDAVRGIGAPHQLVWTAASGRVRGAPVVTLSATLPGAGDYAEKLAKKAERQASFDTLVRHIRALPGWPEPPSSGTRAARPLTRAAYRALQSKPLVLSLAHLRCLSAGELHDRVEAQLERARKKGTPPLAEWRQAETHVDAYIEASLRHTPWSLSPDGRLKKSAK